MLQLCLVIQRDLSDVQKLFRSIESSGFKPYGVDSISDALHVMGQWHFDAAVLNADGFGSRVPEMIAQLGRTHVALVVLSSGTDEDEHARWSQLGANEVFIQPTAPGFVGTMIAKLTQSRTRPASELPVEVRFGPLLVDTRRIAASVDAIPLNLTGREFKLLLLLVLKAGNFVQRQSIALALKPKSGRGVRSVDMLICRIRGKLREAGDPRLQIKSIYGVGYSLTLIKRESH